MVNVGKVSNVGGKKSDKLKKGGYTGLAAIGEYIPASTLRYPKSIIKINTCKHNDRENGCLHACQKPLSLMEYLVKTYTNESELILDFTAGSFSTGVACVNTNRKFIGIELDEKYFEIGKSRMIKAYGK